MLSTTYLFEKSDNILTVLGHSEKMEPCVLDDFERVALRRVEEYAAFLSRVF